MWSNKGTAFLLIHRSGAHRPFETLDKFLRNFREVLEKQSSRPLAWQHELQRHEDWIEHYVRIMPQGSDKQEESEQTDDESRKRQLSEAVIDFYEYYWDRYMARAKIDVDDLLNWLGKASEGARRFYKWYPPNKSATEEASRLFKKDGEFRYGGYIVMIGRFFKGIWYLRQALTWLGKTSRLGWPAQLVAGPLGWIIELGMRKMADMLCDADIYTCSNVRSWKYQIRTRILDGAVEELRKLLVDDDYDQIIVVGHSLGSVIAYDALNRIVLQMNAEGNGQIEEDKAQKIKGLVTFGSPLDKVAFFFRDIPECRDDGAGRYPRECIMYQVLSHHHSFRSMSYAWEEALPIEIACCNKRILDGAKWLNFYHPEDMYAGSLDAYDKVKNIKCEKPVRGICGIKHPEAHEVYWTDDEMYKEIASEFLQ